MNNHIDDPTNRLREGNEPYLAPHLPDVYTNWIDEQKAWRESCSIGNWSFMRNLQVEGPDALEMFSDLSINSFENFETGTAKHAVQCNEDGEIISEGVLLRLEDDRFTIQGLPANYLKYRLKEDKYDATAELLESFVYQVQGPNAIDVMESITDDSIRGMNFMNSKNITIEGKDVLALRHGMSGEIGFELHGPQEYGDKIYESILEAGEEYGIQQLGLRTLTTTRLETGLPQANLDYIPAPFTDRIPSAFSISGSFDAPDISAWHRTPVELGWGHYIDFDHDFIGREALKDEAQNPKRKLVTLVWDEDDVIDTYASLFKRGETNKYMEMPMKLTEGVLADSVMKDGDLVGISTNPGYIYHFREMLSLCTIDVKHSEPGTEVTIEWGEGSSPKNSVVEDHSSKYISAKVAKAPYNDADRRKDT